MANATVVARVRNPKKSTFIYIDLPTIAECSLYPTARSTQKPEARLLSVFTELSILVSHEMQNLFSKFRAQHKGPDETCYLAGSYLELL